MANNIKGITIEIGGDTSKLEKALQAPKKEANALQKELQQIEKDLKFNPTSIELWKQKQTVLKQEIEATSDQLNVLKEAEKQAKQQLNAGTLGEDQYRNLQREILETESRLKKLKEEANLAKQALDKISDVTGKAGKALTTTGQTLTNNVTVPIAAVGAASVKLAADFDTEMSKVQAISGASGDDMIKLRDKAREMGVKTKFSASDAAKGMEYMAMAGWKTNDMLDGLDGIMNLAAASGEDLGTTSDIVTDALTAFGLSASDSGHLADIMAAASSNANTNVALMGETFKYVAPVAGAMGYSAEDCSVAIGLMANAGIKGSQAGTSLRSIMSRMADPTDEVAAAMETLGVSLQDDNGRMYSFREIMDQLRKGFGTLKPTAEEYNATMQDLNTKLANGTITQEEYDTAVGDLQKTMQRMDVSEFDAAMADLNAKLADGTITEEEYNDGCADLINKAYGAEGALKAQAAVQLAGKDSLAGLMAIVGAAPDDYDKLTAAVDNCDGSAEKMSATMQNNLNGRLTTLKSKVEEAGISIGEALMPAMEKLVGKLSGLVDWFNSLDDSQKETIISIAGMVAVVGPLILAFGLALTAVSKVTGGISSLITGFTRAADWGGKLIGLLSANPTFAIIAGITAVVTAVVLLYNNCEEFRNFVNAAVEKGKEIFEKVKEALVKFFTETLPNGIQGAIEWFQSIPGKIDEALGSLAEWFGTLFSNAYKAVTDAFAGFGEWAGGIWTSFTEALGSAGTWIGDQFAAGYKALTDAFAGFGEWAGGIWTSFTEALGSVGTWIGAQFRGGYKLLTNAFSGFTKWIGGIWDAIPEALGGAAQWFSDTFAAAYGKITDAFSPITEFLSGLWDTVTEKMGGIGVAVGEAIGGGVKTVINSVLQTVEDAINSAFGLINGAIDLINMIPGVWIEHMEGIKLPRLAKGGVVAEGMAVIAEAGPELLTVANGRAIVTPLNNAARNEAAGAAGGTNITQNNYISSPKHLSAAETARQTRLQTRQLLLKFGRA